jgi:RNA polymerase sigma-70 factor, ECF subfamily
VDPETRTRLNALMARLAEGDRAAFEPIYDALWPLAARFSGRVLHDAVEAEDAAQTALMKIFVRAHEFETGRDAVAWVLGAVAYECRTIRTRQRRRREQSYEETRDDSQVESEEAAVIRQDLLDAAREVMGGLSSVDVMTLREASSDERTDALTPTFRKRLQRALVRFKAAWSARHDND